MTNRFVIAGTGSGVGKTTFTIGLLYALKARGLVAQGFKCGPDYIDPSYHTAVTGRVSRNIDTWILDHDIVETIVARASESADVAIIEGVMGFYDGKSPLSDAGSTAEVSVVTKSPVILVVNAASMARSVAAVVKGFQTLSSEPNITGVLVNQIGSKSHFELVKAAIEQECNVPVFGYLTKGVVPIIPSRHLGLIPAIERGELDDFFKQVGEKIAEHVDLDLLLEVTKAPKLEAKSAIFDQQNEQSVHLAVAKDAAFNFYYEENLELLEANGAVLHYFSPLANERVPTQAQGLYIGGGFPEEFAAQLSVNKITKQSILAAIAQRLPTLAECGGYMYLTNAITTRAGETFPMLGVVNGQVKMQEKLAALGYREITGVTGNFLIGEGETAKGHEFHYSTFEGDVVTPAYMTKGRFKSTAEGCLMDNVVAGYTHFHFASNPQLVKNWLTACKEIQK